MNRRSTFDQSQKATETAREHCEAHNRDWDGSIGRGHGLRLDPLSKDGASVRTRGSTAVRQPSGLHQETRNWLGIETEGLIKTEEQIAQDAADADATNGNASWTKRNPRRR